MTFYCPPVEWTRIVTGATAGTIKAIGLVKVYHGDSPNDLEAVNLAYKHDEPDYTFTVSGDVWVRANNLIPLRTQGTLSACWYTGDGATEPATALTKIVHGYTVPDTPVDEEPATPFSMEDLVSSRTGAWFLASMDTYQDTAKTVPATVDNDFVRVLSAGSGSSPMWDYIAPSDAARPTLQTRNGHKVVRINDVNNDLQITQNVNFPATLVIAGYNEEGEGHGVIRSNHTTTAGQFNAYIGGVENDAGIYARPSGSVTGDPPIIPYGPFVLMYSINGDDTVLTINHDTFHLYGDPGENTFIENISFARNSVFRNMDLAGAFFVEGLLSDVDKLDVSKYFMDYMGMSYTAVPEATFSIDAASSTVLTSTTALTGALTQPSYFPSIVWVGDDTDFAGCQDASGRRLNYLVYSSTDHDTGTGGIYLSCLFGDPLGANSLVLVDDAIDSGFLSGYSGAGSLPTSSSVEGGRILIYGAQLETPYVGKVGSDWVMTCHTGSPTGASGQRTVRASSLTPFGAWSVDNASTVNDVLLHGADTTASYHTGYASWFAMPSQSTVAGSYVINALFVGGDDSEGGFWTGNSDLTVATLQSSFDLDSRTIGITAPPGEYSEGEFVMAPRTVGPVHQWNASLDAFVCLQGAGTVSSGIDPRFSGFYEAYFEDDLTTRKYFPQLLLKPTEVNAHIDQELVNLSQPVILPSPSGGQLLFFAGQELEEVDENHEYILCAEITTA